jgi:4-hydroxy-tetrahydrodipicolinate reductase
MGEAIARAVEQSSDLKLVSGVSRSAAGTTVHAVPVYASVAEACKTSTPSVLVDFTTANVVMTNVSVAIDHSVNVVVGTSGLDANDYAEIDRRARDAGVGVIAAGNFSVLAALLLRASAEIARRATWWEIIDYASAGKIDAPSGTARELAERLAEVRDPSLGQPLASVEGARDARGATIGSSQVHSVRLPSFVVSTEIVFAADGERLSLRHDAGETPAPYVAGTLLAIRAVAGRKGLTRGLDKVLDQE